MLASLNDGKIVVQLGEALLAESIRAEDDSHPHPRAHRTFASEFVLEKVLFDMRRDAGIEAEKEIFLYFSLYMVWLKMTLALSGMRSSGKTRMVRLNLSSSELQKFPVEYGGNSGNVLSLKLVPSNVEISADAFINAVALCRETL